MNALLLCLALTIPAADLTGVRPLGADGQPLNLNFETGTLKDWTATGTAFERQPIADDTVAKRRADMVSRHEGKFWIGGFEKLGDTPTGTLTSVPFKVSHPWASFLIGGGPHPTETCVEIVVTKTQKVVFRAAGSETETLSRVAVDLSTYQNSLMQIRLIDKHTGHWGHLNFDDFRFHADRASIANLRPEPPRDEYPHAGLSPQEAAKAMTVPPGFTVKLFAGEPDVHQPIAFCFDDRGRLIVAEAFVYPRRKPFPGALLPEAERKNGDRIRIFEDTDGDGVHDKATTIIEGLNLVSGIEYGFGGLWIGAAPYLMFIPIDAKTDRHGEPRILLDGWGYEDTHETLNSFIWGPDGWLYGCHGVFTNSRVGKPGTPNAERVPINAGVWRYHPTTHTFEVFAHGTSNPWGLDYNETGDFFVEACVIPHLWHITQGGRYQRQAGQHFNPYTYTDIPTIATHRHFSGNQWNTDDRARSSDLGGGHAHSGLMWYQGGHWPIPFQQALLMGNIHGHRLNMDRMELDPNAGYSGHRAPDFLKTHDKHSLLIAIKSGPDGNAFMIDWYDKQACHTNNPTIWDRTNGRIYKLEYQGTKRVVGLDLSQATDAELVQHQLSANDWYSRHARRILHERHAAGTLVSVMQTREKLRELATNHASEIVRLRAVWALHQTGGISEELHETLLARTQSPLAAWSLRLGLGSNTVRAALLDDKRIVAGPYASMSRAAWLYGITQLSTNDRWNALAAYTKANRDQASNPTLDALLWYAIEPLAAADVGPVLSLGLPMPIPEFAIRRAMATDTAMTLAKLLKLNSTNDYAYNPAQVVPSINIALKGRGRIAPPREWAAVQDLFKNYKMASSAAQKTYQEELTRLSLRFGDSNALAGVRETVLDAKNPLESRRFALESLQEADDPNLPTLLRTLLNDNAHRAPAIRGLAKFEDPATVEALVAIYAKCSGPEKRDIVNTLASRARYALGLLDAIEAKQIPTTDVPAETIRQLRNLGVKAIDARIASVWGTVRDTPADRKKLIQDWSKVLNAPSSPAELHQGRAVFGKVCAQCHTLYGVGGKVGPEITGANRGDLNYLLENIFDPSAVIPKDYAATKLELADGRVLTGIVKEESATTLTLVTATEVLRVKPEEIERRTPSALSMMPDDLTKTLSREDVRALFGDLRHPQQVPMRATADNAKEFFSGKDLTYWTGTPGLWTVENGEIVGRSATGLKRNEFLKSDFILNDFRLTLQLKLTPNRENSGIQFRSEPIAGGEMRGPQADAGAGWWGKLYEESGRGLLAKDGGEMHVKPDDWNEYTIEANGSRIRTWINGKLCVDLDDPKISREGIVGLQMHSGGPIEVRFRQFVLEVK